MTIYFGSPSPVLQNSCVLLDTNNTFVSQEPTIWGYDSGITQSGNPIYIQNEIRFACRPATAASPTILKFVNTSNSTSNVDVSIHGWLISGVPASAWPEQVLNGP